MYVSAIYGLRSVRAGFLCLLVCGVTGALASGAGYTWATADDGLAGTVAGTGFG